MNKLAFPTFVIFSLFFRMREKENNKSKGSERQGKKNKKRKKLIEKRKD